MQLVGGRQHTFPVSDLFWMKSVSCVWRQEDDHNAETEPYHRCAILSNKLNDGWGIHSTFISLFFSTISLFLNFKIQCFMMESVWGNEQ